MAKTKFVWNYGAAGDLMLRSQEIANVCESVAEKMTRGAGVPYKADVKMGRRRVNAAARERADKVAELDDRRKGKEVQGYWRVGKNGKRV